MERREVYLGENESIRKLLKRYGIFMKIKLFMSLILFQISNMYN